MKRRKIKYEKAINAKEVYFGANPLINFYHYKFEINK